jgi:NAD(P)-dependent dehydrogenase (short-subunit alcohol dehydrogenase family)
MRPLDEQTILVTGATDGLGRALARELVDRGATVLLHGRNQERLSDVVAELGPERVRTYTADLASLDEVRRMADEILENEHQLDVLLNNAGIGTTLPDGDGRQESRDGYELRFAVNYLSHYLLTKLLEPLIRRSAPARIVNVSSAGQASIDFDDVMLERGYQPFRAYAQSKLAQVMFTFDMAPEVDGDGVTVNALHPATFMPTKMVFAARGSATSTLEEGMEATLRLVIDESLDGTSGRYFNGLRESRADDQAYDESARARLRELSDRLTGLAH